MSGPSLGNDLRDDQPRTRHSTADLLAAIRGLDAAGGSDHAENAATPAPSEGTGDDPARSRAGACHDALERNSSRSVLVAAPPAAESASATTAAWSTGGDADPWLPDQDGPVSLTGVAAPRTRTIRRSTVIVDKPARRPAQERTRSRVSSGAAGASAVLAPALAAAAASAPPRVIVVGACGGAGATTLTTLLGATLAPQPGALLMVAGFDHGTLAARMNADGGDIEALTAWVREHPRANLQPTTPGTCSGQAGTAPMVLAAPRRDRADVHLDAGTVAALLTAATHTGAAVLVDWRAPLPLPEHVWSLATRVVVAAPRTVPGLLDAEFAVHALSAGAPQAQLSIATVDLHPRTARAVRPALARLRGVGVPITPIPHDRALAADPRVQWSRLRARTRTAVAAALRELLPSDPDRAVITERTPK